VQKLAKQIFTEHHVHSEIVKNKRGGAFCSTPAPSVAPYILLNHTGSLKDLFTVAHEFGHGVHSLLASKQPHVLQHAPLPLAETASTFGELLVTKALLAEGHAEERKQVLMHTLDGHYASIPRQAFFVLFEQFAHEQIPKGATIDELHAKYLALLKQQFGKVPALFAREWVRIPHIFHTPFYCYAYSFGNLLTLALYRMYEKEGAEFVGRYKQFLSQGGSESPQTMLKTLGVDVRKASFWKQGFDVIRKDISQLRKL